MIYYDWERLKRVSNNNPDKMINIIRDIHDRKRTMEVLKIYSEKCHHFIKNDKDFLVNKENATTVEQYIYLHIASKRNYLLYKMLNKNYVEYALVKDFYELDKLKLNRLLSIVDNKIYLKYE